MEKDIFNLANQQIQLAVENALKQISPSNRSVLLRCRSSSSRRNSRKLSFQNTMPRCSVPATKKDLVQYQLHLLSYQTRFQNALNVNIQYSFSLNQNWLTKVNQQQFDLRNIRNFADEFVENLIQTAFLQVNFYHSFLTPSLIFLNSD
jgi:hypothetical protein